MGKSSPTKLQLKHIPDQIVLETIFCLTNQWQVWVGPGGEPNGLRKLSYRKKRLVHLEEIVVAFRPLPAKLVWRKLQKLEDRGLIVSFGPSSSHFRIASEWDRE
jgi:hypothetical protein